MSLNLEPQNINFQNVSVPQETSQTAAKAQSPIANQPIGADSFLSQDQLNNLLMQEYAVQQRRKKTLGFVKLLFLAAVGSIFLFSAKARNLVMKPFRKLLNKPSEITSKTDFNNHTNKLLQSLKQRAIQRSDISPVTLRLIDEAPEDKITLLENISKVAKEYSNSPNGVPVITLKLKEDSKKAQKVLRYALGKPGKLTPKLAESVETVNLNFVNKGARVNAGNDVEFEFIGRTLEGLNKHSNWFTRFLFG